MEEKKIKVYYLDDIPTPYRIGVFRTFNKKFSGIFRVGFCALEEPGRQWSIDFSDLDFEVLPGYQWRPARQKNPISFKWNLSVIRALKSFRPDVVIFSGYIHPTIQMAAYWCRRHHIPYGIACESSFLNSNFAALFGFLKKKFLRRMICGMSFGLPSGKKAEHYLRSLGVVAQPMYFFPNTPDIKPILNLSDKLKDVEQANILLRKLSLPLGKRIILFAGRLIEAKRPLDLALAYIQIHKKLSLNTILVFAGDGPLMPDLKKLSLINKDIYTLGWLKNPEDIYGLMVIADMFVLPSQHEPWGAVVNEAMTAGTVVITTDKVGAAYDLIEEGVTGFRYPAGDTKRLQHLLEYMLKNDNKRKQLGRNAQFKAQCYDHNYAADNLSRAVRRHIITKEMGV